MQKGKRNAKRQNGCVSRPYKLRKEEKWKGKGEKEKYTHLKAEFQRIPRRIRMPSSVNKANKKKKKKEEETRNGKD